MASNKRLKKDFIVNFRGIRGSYPVSGKNYIKYGGDTTCYEIIAGECTIIVDAGTGIVNTGEDMMNKYLKSGKNPSSRTPIEAIILFSHYHVDHLQGLPFFTPIYLPDSTFYMYGPDTSDFTFEEVLTQYISAPYFPVTWKDMHSLKIFRSISQAETIYWGPDKGIPSVVNNLRETDRKNRIEQDSPIRISVMKSYAHPNEGVKVFKIEYNNKSVVIATDVEGYISGDTRLINFSKGVDLLIHDAGYLSEVYNSKDACKQGYGHSTMEMAVQVAKKAKVKKLALVHHEPTNVDKVVDAVERKAKKLFPNVFAAFEGQVVKL
ncbi:MBL fold metallo-hydrolase [candidate division KSB1 bacterium]